ncbi:MAG: class I SAM-dependent methyltransferase [Prosthecobacter sp.]|nr:class I SAM-dependent methyltransferase [Prosthecobacter sp.]
MSDLQSATLELSPLGFRHMDPMPAAEELAHYYAEKYFQENSGPYSASYSDEEIQWFKLPATMADYLVRQRQPQATTLSLLDVGCGEGFFMERLQALGWDVKGYDYSRNGIEHFHPQLLSRFAQGDIYELLNQSIEHGETFDLINLSNVLEHVTDAHALLTRLRPLLSAKGLLRICVPNDFSDFQAYLIEKEKIDKEFWVCTPVHTHYFNLPSLRATIEAAGLRTEHMLADFEIQEYLVHEGSNYIRDRTLGKQAHLARVALDTFYSRNLPAFVKMREAEAECGKGRCLIAFAGL